MPASDASHTQAATPTLDELSTLDELLAAHVPLIQWLAWQRYYTQDAKRACLDPDDIAQEIALAAVKQFRRFDPTRYKFSAWLGCIARHVAGDVHKRVHRKQGNVRTVHATTTAAGEEWDRFTAVADPRADDPADAAAVALVRVLVPVAELRGGACPAAWVRDARTGEKVSVPAADVVCYRGRSFAVGVSFDEGEEEMMHRVRFDSGAVAWVRAAPAAG